MTYLQGECACVYRHAEDMVEGHNVVCTGAPVHYEKTVRPWRGGCVRVHQYTMSKQSGHGAAGVYGCTGTLQRRWCAYSQDPPCLA